MSGVRTGTRLHQLEALRHRIDHELLAAQRRDEPTVDLLRLAGLVDDQIRAEGGTPPAAVAPRPRRRPPLAVDVLITDLQVPTATIRAWAVEHGLIEPGRRGRVALTVVQAYAVHQQLNQTTRKAGTP